MSDGNGPQQWTKVGPGAYAPIGQTYQRIPAGSYEIQMSDVGVVWVPTRMRTDSLIDFDDSASQAVLSSIKDFWAREARFAEFGLPFKRGVLLWGPPGSGKSCTLQLVARDVVERGGVVLPFPPSTGWFLEGYRAFREIQPETPMVVIMEDLEALLEMHDEARVLNLLDGAEHLHKVIFLATTNYPNQLKERITNRPSRFDVRIEVGHPSLGMRKQYLEAITKGGLSELVADKYARDTDGMSLAHLKELFVSVEVLGNDYGKELARMRDMHKVPPAAGGNYL